MDKIKDEALLKVIQTIEKQYGKGAIMRLGDNEKVSIEAISSGSLLIDRALGVGGYPKGRIIEIYGPESSGKTTLALHAIAEAQKNGYAAYIDAEHALDTTYAKNLGVDVDNLILSQPDTGEQALDICENLIRSGSLEMIVIDSVAALVPEAEISGEMGENHVGLHARLMSQAMRKLSGIISKTNTTVIFINQIREKVGVFYGNPETTTGGRALKFYASIRLEIRKGEQFKDGTNVIGNEARISVVKNKVAPPFKKTVVNIYFGTGISKTEEIISLAVDMDIVEKSGPWYSYAGNKIGQGKENVKNYLVMHPDILDEITSKVLEQIKLR